MNHCRPQIWPVVDMEEMPPPKETVGGVQVFNSPAPLRGTLLPLPHLMRELKHRKGYHGQLGQNPVANWSWRQSQSPASRPQPAGDHCAPWLHLFLHFRGYTSQVNTAGMLWKRNTVLRYWLEQKLGSMETDVFWLIRYVITYFKRPSHLKTLG